jgi:hypothetical protein
MRRKNITGCLQSSVKTAMMTLCLQLELKFIGHLFDIMFGIQNNEMAKPNYITEDKYTKVYIKAVISVIHLFENILRATVNNHAGLPALFVRNHSLKFLLGRQLVD